MLISLAPLSNLHSLTFKHWRLFLCQPYKTSESKMQQATLAKPTNQLSEQQKHMYGSESEDNFRWLYRLAASPSPYKLSSNDLASSPELSQFISDIGQFAEIAHGSFSPDVLLASLDVLTQPGFPLEDYHFLRGAKLVRTFQGSASLQGYAAVKEKTLIVAFSGTSSIAQAINDLKFYFKSYPNTDQAYTGAAVHAGFWALFDGIRSPAIEAIRMGIEMGVEEVVFTAHSMGSVMAYYLLLELMREAEEGLLKGKGVKLVVFGCPRAGNTVLVELWRATVERWKVHGTFEEYSIRAYNDGVPAVPPRSLRYAHFASSPLYFYHGQLYHIPASEAEYTNFSVLTPPYSDPPAHPLGGHMYYNSRDMEKLQRSIRTAKECGFGVDGDWEKKFVQHLEETRGSGRTIMGWSTYFRNVVLAKH